MNQSPDKIIEPCDFSITDDGVYIIDKRLGLASVRVALLPSEMARTSVSRLFYRVPAA